MIDLHTHSTASDGSLSPRELVELAASKGLKALAITDHDSVEGLTEGAEAARGFDMRFIRGVEVELSSPTGEFHLLGLDLGEPSPRFSRAVERLARDRATRADRMIADMREAGFDVSREDLDRVSRGSPPSRPHFASLLLEKRIVKTRQEAFDKYLARGRQFYRAKESLELSEAIELIRESGGLAIVAHPLSLFLSWTRLEALFPEWKEAGVDGIEAWHPTAREGPCRRLEALGRAYGFRITAGSDYHGTARPDRKLGRTVNGIVIEDRFLDEIRR